MRLAILDDYQDVALGYADWARLRRRGIDVHAFHEVFTSVDEAVANLAPFDIVVLLRERTPFPAGLIERLPALKLIVLTGVRSPSLDAGACSARRIPISHTRGGDTAASTAELAFGLIVAAARDLAKADRGVRAGRWHEGLAGGTVLEGKRLGVLGLGRLGSRVARYGSAFGMHVVAWSENLTQERALAAGATFVSKDELVASSDFLSIHVVLSQRTRGLLGADELSRMKPGAVLVNTSRAAIVDQAALVEGLRRGRPRHAALDVFDREPLAIDHPLRGLENVTLVPHLGYVCDEVFRVFYEDAVENVEAWLDGKPIRLLNPEALG